MNKFWEMLKESIIVQAFITTLCLTATVVLVIMERDVPQVLETMDYLVVGFYFGSKAIASSRAATTEAIHAFIDKPEQKDG